MTRKMNGHDRCAETRLSYVSNGRSNSHPKTNASQLAAHPNRAQSGSAGPVPVHDIEGVLSIATDTRAAA